MSRARSVAVIGAGIAGLSCARALADAGIPVTVFEKSRGTGGRMSTRRRDKAAWDHGAQYFTARDPAFRAQVASWVQGGDAALWQPRLAVLGGGSPPESHEAPERYVGAPRMTAPATRLAEGLAVLTEKTVSRLERTSAGWLVHVTDGNAPGAIGTSPAASGSAHTGSDGAPVSFSAVAVAIPSPQCKRLLATTAPEMAASAARVAMQPCWSAMLTFDAPPELSFDAAFVNDGPLRWVARNSTKPGREACDAWVLHASAAWSEQHLDATAESAGVALAEAFRAWGAPSPATCAGHRWLYALASAPLDVECLWDATARLGACGDWVLGGRVEGAWLSGRNLAWRVATALSS